MKSVWNFNPKKFISIDLPGPLLSGCCFKQSVYTVFWSVVRKGYDQSPELLLLVLNPSQCTFCIHWDKSLLNCMSKLLFFS